MRLSTETGAGQWGSALAMAGAYFGIEDEGVFMVAASYNQKPGRRTMMETWGRGVRLLSQRQDQLRQVAPGRRTEDPGLAGHRDQ